MGWRTRAAGMGGTSAVFLIIAFAALFTWRAAHPVMAAPAPLAVMSLPLAAPPEPVREVREGPQQVEQKAQKASEQERPEPPEIVIPRVAPLASPPPDEPLNAAEPIPETSAPKSLPAPPARQLSSNAKATWEALLLAHLERYRRYPAGARARHEQGIAYVRFRMNRGGQVLAVDLLRSSGSADLDRAALETIRRAQPLPGIPEDKPDMLDLAVPVEFFVRR